MSIIQALILGIIQGITEFLPISSSGHLMLFENIFGIESGSLFFNVLLHFASLIAVIIIFWKDVVELLKNPFGKRMQTIILATIPTVIIALLVNYFFDEFALSVFLGYGFLISAIVILITAINMNKNKIYLYNTVDKKRGFIIGLIQGLAVFPGISRSGSTICAGLLQGVEREESAKFSFLISIPVIIGGMLFEIVDLSKTGVVEINFWACIVGFVASFLVALLTIKLMMKIVKKGKWWYFSIYLFLLAIFILLNQYVLCLF